MEWEQEMEVARLGTRLIFENDLSGAETVFKAAMKRQVWNVLNNTLQ